MEQTSTTSSTTTMQPDNSFSHLNSKHPISSLPQFMGQQDLLNSQNPLLSQLMAQNSSLQNLPSMQNLGYNSRTLNQFSSSTSFGGNNQNGSNTTINKNNSIQQSNNNNTNNNNNNCNQQTAPAANQISAANSIISQCSNNGSPTKQNIANSLLNSMNNNIVSNGNAALNFLNPANQNLLQFQQHLQQLSNQQFNLAAQNGSTNASNLLGMPFQQTVQQQANQQQLLYHLNMIDPTNLNTLIQQQQQQIKDQLNGAAAFSNLQIMASQLQQLPNVINIKMPICSKHQIKSESTLKFVCTSHNCNQQWQLLCQNCLTEHAPNHEIMDSRFFMTQIKGKIQENASTSNQQFNTIESLFNTNIQGLEGMQEHINNLLDSMRSLQRAYFMMKLTNNNDTAYLLNVVKEIEEPTSNLSEKQLNEKISTISKLSQNIRQVKMENFQQLININQMTNKVVLDTKNNINNTQNIASNLQENFSNLMIGSEMKELEKKHQEEKTLDHFSKLFHLIKGHAKKRDVINFLTWEPQSKELKYSKDIKDKHGEHFYVSFSLKLKNIENMENKDIDENFIDKIVKVVEEKAPEIQNRKNAERKKIDPNGKKRKYCRFNPRIEIDVSLNCSAYKNIKIE